MKRCLRQRASPNSAHDLHTLNPRNGRPTRLMAFSSVVHAWTNQQEAAFDKKCLSCSVPFSTASFLWVWPPHVPPLIFWRRRSQPVTASHNTHPEALQNPTLLGWRPFLLGWRSSLLGWRLCVNPMLLPGIANVHSARAQLQYDEGKAEAWMDRFHVMRNLSLRIFLLQTEPFKLLVAMQHIVLDHGHCIFEPKMLKYSPQTT